jgi:hypothetical protein
MPFPIELSHSTSRSASEQQEPTDITIVSTNIDEPEPSTAASSTVQEEKLTAKGRKVTCKRTYPQTRKGKGKGKSKRSRTKELDDTCKFAINHTVKEMILFVAILVSHGLIGTARS